MIEYTLLSCVIQYSYGCVQCCQLIFKKQKVLRILHVLLRLYAHFITYFPIISHRYWSYQSPKYNNTVVIIRGARVLVCSRLFHAVISPCLLRWQRFPEWPWTCRMMERSFKWQRPESTRWLDRGSVLEVQRPVQWSTAASTLRQRLASGSVKIAKSDAQCVSLDWNNAATTARCTTI
jgi:hypothetical protein